MSATEDRVAQHWTNGGRSSRMYDRTVKNKRLFGLMCRMLWGADVRVLYRDIAKLATAGSAVVLDLPAGGGLAFRGLTPEFSGRYVAADVSEFMLGIARREAERRGLGELTIDYVVTRADSMPFDDATFDVCVCYNGVHCFTDPAAAVAEIVRVLKPGGELRGTAVVRGSGFAMLSIGMFQRRDNFGPVLTDDELASVLRAAGLAKVEVERRGAYCRFAGIRPE
jgi:ubiquinone/menaquinone biosynthesis C-methylase UbiE